MNNESEIIKNTFSNHDFLDQLTNNLMGMTFIPFEVKTPSEIKGLSSASESVIRVFMIQLIQEAGILLRLPQQCTLTGMAIFNKFYYKQSLVEFDPVAIATSSLFLATKIEEESRRIREIISVFYFLISNKENPGRDIEDVRKEGILNVMSDTYQFLKQNCISMEYHIQKELGYSYNEVIEHPHKYLIHFVKLLKGSNNLLQKVCYFFLSNLILTTFLHLGLELLKRCISNICKYLFSTKYSCMCSYLSFQ